MNGLEGENCRRIPVRAAFALASAFMFSIIDRRRACGLFSYRIKPSNGGVQHIGNNSRTAWEARRKGDEERRTHTKNRKKSGGGSTFALIDSIRHCDRVKSYKIVHPYTHQLSLFLFFVEHYLNKRNRWKMGCVLPTKRKQNKNLSLHTSAGVCRYPR